MFAVTEVQRYRIGLPMTTLKLTALSFALVMLVTSAAWYPKPSIGRPRPIQTVNNKTIKDIRTYARQHIRLTNATPPKNKWSTNIRHVQNHPNMLEVWYQSPLDFVGRIRFRINVHWNFYTRLAGMARLPSPARSPCGPETDSRPTRGSIPRRPTRRWWPPFSSASASSCCRRGTFTSQPTRSGSCDVSAVRTMPSSPSTAGRTLPSRCSEAGGALCHRDVQKPTACQVCRLGREFAVAVAASCTFARC
jgi:hypothetical protein